MGSVVGASVERSEEAEPEAAATPEVTVPEMVALPKMLPLESPMPTKAVVTATVTASASQDDRAIGSRSRLTRSQKEIRFSPPAIEGSLVGAVVQTRRMDHSGTNIRGRRQEQDGREHNPLNPHGIPPNSPGPKPCPVCTRNTSYPGKTRTWNSKGRIIAPQQEFTGNSR